MSRMVCAMASVSGVIFMSHPCSGRHDMACMRVRYGVIAHPMLRMIHCSVCTVIIRMGLGLRFLVLGVVVHGVLFILVHLTSYGSAQSSSWNGIQTC